VLKILSKRKISVKKQACALVFFAASASSVALAGELVPLSPKYWPLTSNMKRAHNVEVQEVKTLPGERTSVVALLNFDNRSQVTCRYVMQTKRVEVKGKTAIQFLPESEKCEGIASSNSASEPD
jgi:hypothetical protein